MRFKIRSTQIELSYTLICFAAIGIIITSFEGFLFCLLSIIIHEAGHLTAMCILGYPLERIKLSLLKYQSAIMADIADAFLITF